MTNANINTVTVTETETEYHLGNVETSKEVTVNKGNDETKTTALTTSMNAGINLGATWFFTENVRFDAYILNTFGSNTYDTLFSTAKAGASVTVKF